MEFGKYKTCVIALWYGEFPFWMPHFFNSIATNPEFNWLLVCNKKPKGQVPGNCSILVLEINELQQLIEQTIGIRPCIKHPYKLCDFKPAYGEIFADKLRQFDYWGYCDIDLMFGDLSHFLDKHFLKGFDVYSPDRWFFPGHFCLFRNTNTVNRAYREIDKITEYLESEKIYMLDEFKAKKGVLPSDKNIRSYVRRSVRSHKLKSIGKQYRLLSKVYKMVFRAQKRPGFEDFNAVLKSKHKQLEIIMDPVHLSDVSLFKSRVKNWSVLWDAGKLIYDMEKLYFHFQLTKSSKRFNIRTSGGKLILECKRRKVPVSDHS